MFTFCPCGVDLRVLAPPFVPASQCALGADDAAFDIDPPSPYRPGWYAAREQCLGAVSLFPNQKQEFATDWDKIPPRTWPEEGWSSRS
jgi:hypothetical protein